MTEIEKKERHRQQAREWYREHHKGELRSRGRFSGTDYKNSKEKLEALREKYKDGVPVETMNNFFDGIGFKNRLENGYYD